MAILLFLFRKIIGWVAVDISRGSVISGVLSWRVARDGMIRLSGTFCDRRWGRRCKRVRGILPMLYVVPRLTSEPDGFSGVDSWLRIKTKT